MGEDGKYDQHIQGPLKDARLDDYELPTADRLGGVVQARKTVEPYKAEWFAIGTVENPFKRAWLLRGFENFLADLCLNSDFTEELLDRLFELATEQARRLISEGVKLTRDDPGKSERARKSAVQTMDLMRKAGWIW